MKIEVSEMLESTEDNRQKLEQKKSILDKFGLGKNIDSAISDMANRENQLNELGDSLLGTTEMFEKNFGDVFPEVHGNESA